jgi:hypothetical protein
MAEYKDIKGFKVQTVSTDPAASIIATGVWASGVALPTAIKGFASAGTQTAAIAAGGENEPGDKLTSTFEYDGSSWTTGGNLNAGKRENAGAGTQTAALSMGGDLPPYTGQTEEYNGSSWSEQNDLMQQREERLQVWVHKRLVFWLVE